MKLLLIVGTANDIFIYNYAKWLKKSMDVTIDVFEFYPSKQQEYGNEYYDNVTSAKGCVLPISRGKSIVDVIVRGRNLNKFLKDKHYDIIHSHWVVAPIALQTSLKRHCDKLVLTFWGGEFKNQRILGSKKLYRYFISHLSKDIDCIINSGSGKQKILDMLPHYKGLYKGIWGRRNIQRKGSIFIL